MFLYGKWGDVYRSTGHGATWVTVTVGLTWSMYIRGGLAISPVTPALLFARGLEKATDLLSRWPLGILGEITLIIAVALGNCRGREDLL